MLPTLAAFLCNFNVKSKLRMSILPQFDLGAFMSNSDLPLYGQVFAYGIGLAGLGFGCRQLIAALAELLKLLRRKDDKCPR